jgi:hypothetical protein
VEGPSVTAFVRFLRYPDARGEEEMSQFSLQTSQFSPIKSTPWVIVPLIETRDSTIKHWRTKLNTASRISDLLGGIGTVVLGLAATTPVLADITLTPGSPNLVLVTQYQGASDISMDALRPEVTGGHGGTLVPYSATGTAFGPAPSNDASKLNNGDIGDTASDMNYAVTGFGIGGRQDVNLAFSEGTVKIKGIAIYGGYSSDIFAGRASANVAGTYTLTDSAGVVLGEWSDDGVSNFAGSTGIAPGVSDYWMTFPTPVTTSVLHLSFNPYQSVDMGSYREIQVFSMTPAEQIEGVIAAVDAIDPLNAGIGNSLLASLGGALDKLDPTSGVDVAAARAKLNAFINKVMAQSGKALTKEEADSLIAMARAILAQL